MKDFVSYLTFNSLFLCLILFSPTKLTITQHYLPPPPKKNPKQNPKNPLK